MQRHLCRCCSYLRILEATHRAVQQAYHEDNSHGNGGPKQ
jgi:aerobic-type carbon monoxide dehydrogenase small subunit (CoxS/CutS family)